MKNQFLYRALRSEEIVAGNLLIPKSSDPFLAHPRLDIDTRLPFILGPTEESAVRQHQWAQAGYPTCGVSTTPHLDRAKFYAQTHRTIVRIDRTCLQRLGIKEFVVKEWLDKFPNDTAVPEDDEIILVNALNMPFPKEIIADVLVL
jgi:hypothetical protein